MKPLHATARPPSSGFRFSPQDGAVLVIGALATWIWWRVQSALAPALPIVLGHFFLFCNVFRISRRSELIWAGCFLINAVFWAMQSNGLAINWMALLLVQAPITLILILIEIFRPGYHGIGASHFQKSHE